MSIPVMPWRAERNCCTVSFAVIVGASVQTSRGKGMDWSIANSEATSVWATAADGASIRQISHALAELSTIKLGKRDIVGFSSMSESMRLPNCDPTEIHPGGQQLSTISTDVGGAVMSVWVLREISLGSTRTG